MGRVKSIPIGILLSCAIASVNASTEQQEPRYASSQIRNPVSTALASAVTGGMWPAQFGDDLAAITTAEDGWSKMQADALIPHARAAFENARRFWWALGFGTAIYFLFRRKKRKKRFSVV